MREIWVVAAALAAIPAAWFALVLIDRIPRAQPLWVPRPHVPFPRGLSLGDAAVYPVCVGAFVLGALRFERVGPLLMYLAFFLVLTALSVIDIELLRLPDRLVLPSSAASVVLIGAVSLVMGEPGAVGEALAAALLYFGVLLGAHLLHPAGMGFGDVKLAFLMGLYLGWPVEGAHVAVMVVWAMLIGFALGSVVGVAVLVLRGRSAPYPFGPFLVLGTVVVVLAAEELLPATAELRF